MLTLAHLYAFVDHDNKARLLVRLNRAIAEFEGRMSVDSWRSKLDRSRAESDFAKRYLELQN